MGAYHSKVSEARGRGTNKTREQIFKAFDYALTRPYMVLTEVGPKFGIGSSTMANWLFCSTKVAPNTEVIDWLKSRVTEDGSGPTKMQLWEQERPNNRISARMRAAVRGIVQDDSPQPNVVGVGLALADALPQVLASARGQEIVAEVSGKFTPQTPDDLLVLIEQATTIKAEAEATAQEAAELIAAVGMVRDWVNNQSRLADALREVEHLKAQLVAADKAKLEYQRKALAANQVHSTD